MLASASTFYQLKIIYNAVKDFLRFFFEAENCDLRSLLSVYRNITHAEVVLDQPLIGCLRFRIEVV